jgi:hypothetical protein
MIFLSHTHTDKSLVDTIAKKLAVIFGKEEVFYDSWSIQPGDGIIDQMNNALENCKYFFFFVSKKSLQSNMVKIEWQNALHKSTHGKIKIIPVKIDDCIMPSVLSQILYINIYLHGLEIAIRQMIDVIKKNDAYILQNEFSNIRAYIKKELNMLNIEFRAEFYLEPQSMYIILVNNSIDELSYKAINETFFIEKFSENVQLDDGRNIKGAILLGRSSATSPGFPFIIQVIAKEHKTINFIDVMHTISQGKFKDIPIIYL